MSRAIGAKIGRASAIRARGERRFGVFSRRISQRRNAV
jgi:hypothetical protein